MPEINLLIQLLRTSIRHNSNRYLTLLFAGALCLIPALFCLAATATKTVTQYKVSSMGFSIGEVMTTQRMAHEGSSSKVSFETRSAVKASFLWMGYQLSTIEKGAMLNGSLISYSKKGQENGVGINVEGRLTNDEFLFDAQEQGEKRTVVIPRSSYDYTTMECPEARLDFSAKPQITVRILDVEKMAVVKREYRLVANSHYTIAGKDYPCRIVDFSDCNKKARRWIAWDGSAVVMYRQDSKGEKNSYSVQASSVIKEI